MAGFENTIVFSQGEKLQPSSSDDIGRMQELTTDVSRINHTGNPEGVVSANPSSLSHDPTTGNFYLKVSGTGNTGWMQIIAGPNSITYTPDNGGAITPSGNLNVNGATYGTSATPTLDTDNVSGNLVIQNRSYETPYVVDPSSTVGMKGSYQTIQAAINAAVTDGAAFGNYKRITLRVGTYTENLTIPGGIMLQGQVIPDPSGGLTTPYQSTVITGNHTFTGLAVSSAENINFLSTSGDIFVDTSASAVLFYMRNCFYAPTDGVSNIFNLTTVSGPYLSFYECTLGSGGQQIINMPNAGQITMVDCQFPQAGVINTVGATLTLIDSYGIGSLVCSSASLALFNCTFNSNTATYNISGTAAGIIQDCYFHGTSSFAIQNTVTATLLNCHSDIHSLVQPGFVAPQPYSTQGNIMQGVTTTIAGLTPYTIPSNAYFNGINNTVAGGQCLLDSEYCQGQVIIIKDITGNAATNNINVTSSGGKLIDGLTSQLINTNYGSLTLRCIDGTNFNII